MTNLESKEVSQVLKLLEEEAKLVAMLAPSFPIEFSFPQIASQLKRLGFAKVVEVARGAMETNKNLLKVLKENPKKRYLTSPCPAIVRLIRHKYPHLSQYLAPVHSPMIYTAEIVLKKWPDYRPVFIGPCPVKKIEAKEDYPKLKIIVLTFKELKQIFKIKKIKAESQNHFTAFDLIGRETRLYPISGGLAQSSDFIDFLTDEEYDVISGPKLVEKVLKDFAKNKKLKVLDILYCDGGCIAGAGIDSQLSLKQRREKIITHWV